MWSGIFQIPRFCAKKQRCSLWNTFWPKIQWKNEGKLLFFQFAYMQGWCILKFKYLCKEIQPVHPKGDQSWVFIERTDVEAETPILGPPDAKSWLIWKDPDAGKDWGQEEKGMTGWNGWMASPTRWTWVWVVSGNWWGTRRPGVLRFMGSQRVGHEWVTELNWAEIKWVVFII